ncbi:MAG: hypothetical protein MUO39_04275, partial [Steroidobacteraceae bacterium]|nr:hypothetical protein [Steroidobacteraceae bacterium]
MKFKTLGTIAIAVSVTLGATASAAPSKSTGKLIGVNVVLKQDVTNDVLADIARYGKVRDVVYEIDALT